MHANDSDDIMMPDFTAVLKEKLYDTQEDTQNYCVYVS